eukprot:TRINITY_DN1147_c0_g1_i1.p1 TRINITY_DN1147_c0_g1~~TRINITY_DN1147_c0_g1_i1.p1  ORF type:complete len:344 (-),score=83.94 TRINITY_DN1147_c0_g1_i1:13-1044(-)
MRGSSIKGKEKDEGFSLPSAHLKTRLDYKQNVSRNSKNRMVGAYRDRTKYFVTCRNKHKSQLKKEEKDVELGLDDENKNTQELIFEGSKFKPAWTVYVDEAHRGFERVEQKVKDLKTVQEKHLMPSFDDKNEEGEAIELMSGEIQILFSQIQKRIMALSANPEDILPQEAKMKENLQKDLASTLQSYTHSYTTQQRSFLSRLERRAEQAREVIGIDPLEGLDESYQDDDELIEMGFTQQQLEEVSQIEKDGELYTKEIINLQKSINELASMFRDMHTLVVEQGTLLDRIDYNIQNTHYNVKKGTKQVEKAEEQVKKTGTKMVMLFLLIALFVCTIFVMLKILV